MIICVTGSSIYPSKRMITFPNSAHEIVRLTTEEKNVNKKSKSVIAGIQKLSTCSKTYFK